jgi:hypothetical protein
VELDLDDTLIDDLEPITLALTSTLSITLYDGGGVTTSYAVLRAHGRPVLLLAAADA